MFQVHSVHCTVQQCIHYKCRLYTLIIHIKSAPCTPYYNNCPLYTFQAHIVQFTAGHFITVSGVGKILSGAGVGYGCTQFSYNLHETLIFASIVLPYRIEGLQPPPTPPFYVTGSLVHITDLCTMYTLQVSLHNAFRIY